LSEINYFNIPGYQKFYNNANFNLHDGVVMYIEDSLSASVEVQKLRQITILRAEFEYNDVKHGISACYRLPAASVDTFLDDFSEYLTNLRKRSIEVFVGDVNINILDTKNKIVNEYLTVANSNGYSSYINKPTRVTETSETCIDHFFVNNINCKSKTNISGFILENSITDHYTTLLNIEYYSKQTNRDVADNFIKSKINLEQLNILLADMAWEDVLECDDPETAVNAFIGDFKDCLSRCTTDLRVKRNKKLKPWITHGIINSIGTRDKLKKRLLRNEHNNETQIQHFKDYRNRLTKVIKYAKNNYYKNKLVQAKNNYKHIWNIINEASSYKSKDSSKINSINSEGGTIYNSETIAEHFNEYFVDVGVKMARNFGYSNDDASVRRLNVPSSMFVQPIQANELITLINKLKNDTAPGLDGITANVIKSVHLRIIEPLRHIINLIISTGKIPKQFKTAVVTPIHKSGNKNDIQNYRPISQITCFAKILELYLKKCLMSFIASNNILSAKQFGFIKGLSTEHAISKLVDKVLEGFNSNKCTIAVFWTLPRPLTLFHTTSYYSSLNV